MSVVPSEISHTLTAEGVLSVKGDHAHSRRRFERKALRLRARFDAASRLTNLPRAIKRTGRAARGLTPFCIFYENARGRAEGREAAKARARHIKNMRDAWPRRAKRGRGQVGATSLSSHSTRFALSVVPPKISNALNEHRFERSLKDGVPFPRRLRRLRQRPAQTRRREKCAAPSLRALVPVHRS